MEDKSLAMHFDNSKVSALSTWLKMNELVRKDEECVSNSGIPIARNFTPAFVYSLLCTIYKLIATPYLLDLEGSVILGRITFKNIFINCKDKYKPSTIYITYILSWSNFSTNVMALIALNFILSILSANSASLQKVKINAVNTSLGMPLTCVGN